MSAMLITAIGFVAQLLFSARLIVQWIASERAKKLLSPVLFWQLSMLASFLLCIYGWLRHDFAIIQGQLLAYYVYVWNLNVKGSWKSIPVVLRWVFVLLPIAAVLYGIADWKDTFVHLFDQDNIPEWLIIFGVVGQCIFSVRFIYQWWYSRRAGVSALPINFWIISLTGSAIIVSYAIIRQDVVLLLGQSFGMVIYARNIVIGIREKGLRR